MLTSESVYRATLVANVSIALLTCWWRQELCAAFRVLSEKKTVMDSLVLLMNSCQLFLPDVTMMMCLLPLSSGSHFFADQRTQSQQSIATAFFLWHHQAELLSSNQDTLIWVKHLHQSCRHDEVIIDQLFPKLFFFEVWEKMEVLSDFTRRLSSLLSIDLCWNNNDVFYCGETRPRMLFISWSWQEERGGVSGDRVALNGWG